MVPNTCDICGVYVGSSYDVHAVLQHPDSRPVILLMRQHRLNEMSKTKAQKKAEKKRAEGMATRTAAEEYDPLTAKVD